MITLVPRLRTIVPAAALLLVLAGCGGKPEPVVRDFDPDSVPDAFLHPVGALMWPGATRAFQVTSDGDLTNGVWILRVRPSCDSTSAASPRRIAAEDRWMPVLRWSRASGPVHWTFEAVASPSPRPGLFADRGVPAAWLARRMAGYERQKLEAALANMPESRMDRLLLRVRRPSEVSDFDRAGLLVSLELRVVNPGPSARHARVQLELGLVGSNAPFVVSDAGAIDSSAVRWARAGRSEAAVAWSDVATSDSVARAAFDLAPGEERRLRVVLTAYPMRGAELDSWSRTAHAARVAGTRAYWSHEVERGAGFDLGDPELENAVRAARVVLLSLRERRGDAWAPIGGPFHYRDVWLRDGARALQALALSGYVSEARAMAPTFLSFQWPHGPFLSQTGQLDGTGQALWAFDQVWLRPTPGAGVARYAEAARRAWCWFERQRASTRAGDLPGMLPRTNPHDGELVDAQLVGNDAWAIAGYRATARLLRAAGRRTEADAVERTRVAYQNAFDAALSARGERSIPPSWQGGGLDWGNLAVAYPCLAVPAGEPMAAATARDYWRRAGFPLGFYASDTLLHGYVGADLGTWALLAGDRTDAERVLVALLEWRNAAGGAGETFARGTHDFGLNFPPHPTAAAAFLTLVRNAVIYDEDDTLRLTLGARSRWWQGAHVRRAPSRWGMLDLEFERRGGLATWRWTPVPVWTALTLPPGTGVRGALLPPLLAGPRRDVVLCPPHTSFATLPLDEASPPAERTALGGSTDREP
jgi:hypothetical protein